MSSNSEQDVSVGQRLEYDGYYGTIRFIGELEAGKGKILVSC